MAHDSQDPFELGRRGLVAEIVPQPVTQRGGHHAGWLISERSGIGRVDADRQRFEIGRDLPGVIGATSQKRNRVALGDVGHQRQQLVTDAVANEAGIGVGFIDDGIEIEIGAELMGLGSPKRQDRVAVTGLDSGQADNAGPPKQVDEQRLGLVVGGVPGHRLRADRSKASHAGPLFEVGARLDLDPLLPERGAESFGRGGNHRAVIGRGWAKPVVDVDHGDSETGGGGQHQEGQRVRPAGDRADNVGVSRREGTAGQ